MKKVIITKEMIRDFPYKSKERPGRPYCRLCCCFDRKATHYDYNRKKWIQGNFHVHIFQPGEPAVLVKFKNGTFAYYEISCWENRHNAERVRRILKQEYPKKKLSAS